MRNERVFTVILTKDGSEYRRREHLDYSEAAAFCRVINGFGCGLKASIQSPPQSGEPSHDHAQRISA